MSDDAGVGAGAGSEPEEEPIDDPSAYMDTATERFLETIGNLPDPPAERFTAENEAVQELVGALGRALAAGASPGKANSAATLIGEETSYTKTDATTAIDNAAERATHGDDDAVAIDVYLRNAVQSTIYRWRFDDGENDPFQIETGQDTKTSHQQWQALRSAISDVAGVWTLSPTEQALGTAGWPDYIGPFINDIREDVTTRGPRTTAVEELQAEVARSIAYADIEAMRQHDGTMLDGDPDAADEVNRPTEPRIASKSVTSICDEIGVTPRALQAEVDARGYTVERLNGTSERTYVNSAPFSYWVLSPDFATPARYEPEPEGAVGRMARKSEADRERARDTGRGPGPGGDY